MAIITKEPSTTNVKSLNKDPFTKRFSNLKVEQSKMIATWKDLSIWQNPTRGSFFTPTPNNGTKIDHKTLVDSYARRCIRDFAAGMLSGLTSPARPWFKLGLEDKDLEKYEPVKVYLDTCQSRMRSVFSRSNIYEALYILYEELATFGTGAMFLLEDYQDVLRARSFTAGEYMLGTGADNRVNAFGRQYWMSVSQLVKEFGLEICSKDVQNRYKNHDTDTWVKVNHLIEENDDRIESYIDFKNMAFRAVYYEESSDPKKYLRIEGFEEFPVLGPRWSLTTTADTYGKSAGWDALGDVKQLQKEQKEKLLGIMKNTNPPMQADSSVQNVNTLPGGLTRSSAITPNAGVRPAYQVSIDLNGIREDILEIKKALSDAYYRDLFKGILDIDRTGVTAYEIAEKKAEQLNLASPLILRVTNEVGNPLISNSYRICNNLGVLPEITPELEQLIGGMDIKIQYIGVLAQAQKMIGISAIDQWANTVYNDAAVFGADALDSINIDEKEAETADMLGIPSKIVASPEQIAEKRKARQEAQEAHAKAQQLAASIEVAGKGAKAMKDASQAELGKNSALDKVASMAGGK